jgi:hypothetical protein
MRQNKSLCSMTPRVTIDGKSNNWHYCTRWHGNATCDDSVILGLSPLFGSADRAVQELLKAFMQVHEEMEVQARGVRGRAGGI